MAGNDMDRNGHLDLFAPAHVGEDLKRRQTCCFTGHRDLPTGRKLEKKLEQTIRRLIESGIIYFGAGGAMGFDTLAARTVLRLRKKFPAIRLILVLPCRNQTAGWPARAVAEYQDILRRADKAVWLSEQYYTGCMQARKRYLVGHSGGCVCYLQHPGGTKYTVISAVLPVVNLAEHDAMQAWKEPGLLNG